MWTGTGDGAVAAHGEPARQAVRRGPVLRRRAGPRFGVFRWARRHRATASQAGGYRDGVRLSGFWERMNAQFGAGYAESLAKDYVFADLGGRTIMQALADGEDAKAVWQAVCDTFPVPERLR